MLSEEEIRHVARIARIELSDEEVHRFRRDFEQIFELLRKVEQLPLAGAEPVVATDNRSVLRDDTPQPDDPEAILLNVPRKKGRYVVVPRNM